MITMIQKIFRRTLLGRLIMSIRIKSFIRMQQDKPAAFAYKRDFYKRYLDSLNPECDDVKKNSFDNLSPINRHDISKLNDNNFDKLVKTQDLRKDLSMYGHMHSTRNLLKNQSKIFDKIDEIYRKKEQ